MPSNDARKQAKSNWRNYYGHLCILILVSHHHSGWPHASLRGCVSHIYGCVCSGFGWSDIDQVLGEKTHSQVDLCSECNCNPFVCVHGTGIPHFQGRHFVCCHWRCRHCHGAGRLDNRLGNSSAKGQEEPEQWARQDKAVHLRRQTTHPTETCGRVAFLL